MSVFELRPFVVAEAEMVAHWAATVEDVWQVASVRQFPLTGRQVMQWTLETNFAFTLRRDGDLAAYGEILEDDVEGDAEIQHLLVAPDLRRQGIGREMLLRLCAFLAEQQPYPEVWMRARRDNIPALRCAQSAELIPVEPMSGPQYLWLKKTLKNTSSS